MNCGWVCVVLVLFLDLVLFPFLRRVRSRVFCGLRVLFLVLIPFLVVFVFVVLFLFLFLSLFLSLVLGPLRVLGPELGRREPTNSVGVSRRPQPRCPCPLCRRPCHSTVACPGPPKGRKPPNST